MALVETRPGPINRSGAATDGQLVEVWLSTKRSPHTRIAYSADAADLLAFLDEHRGGKTLGTTTVADVQAWADSLSGSLRTRIRRITAVRGLLAFGQRTGYLLFNVGAGLVPPHAPTALTERILTEEEVEKLVSSAGSSRLLVRFLYASGARVIEVQRLRWKHLRDRSDGCVTVELYGKGDKVRYVILPKRIAQDLLSLRGGPDDFVFAGRTERPYSHDEIERRIRLAARRAGIPRVTPHWLRHSHASHALDHGAPVHLVQATLGHENLATTGRYLHAKPGDSAGLYLPLEK